MSNYLEKYFRKTLDSGDNICYIYIRSKENRSEVNDIIYGVYESVKENITAYAVFAIGKYSEQELRAAGYEKIAEARNQREALAKCHEWKFNK